MNSVMVCIETFDEGEPAIKIFKMPEADYQVVARELLSICITPELAIKWMNAKYKKHSKLSLVHSRKRVKFNSDYCFVMANGMWLVKSADDNVGNIYVKSLMDIYNRVNTPALIYA